MQQKQSAFSLWRIQHIARILLCGLAIGVLIWVLDYFLIQTPSRRYEQGCAQWAAGDAAAAAESFYQFYYRDSAEKLQEVCAKDASLHWYTEKVGNTVTFGRFEQDGKKKTTDAIRWYIVDSKDGKWLLESVNVLAAMPMDENGVTVWEDTSLYGWLNQDFFSKAFNKKEQALLADLGYGKVFLLGKGDPAYVKLPNGESALTGAAKPSAVVAKKIKKEQLYKNEDGTFPIWQRTYWKRGEYKLSGHEYRTAFNASDKYGVRPCIWIDPTLIGKEATPS